MKTQQKTRAGRRGHAAYCPRRTNKLASCTCRGRAAGAAGVVTGLAVCAYVPRAQLELINAHCARTCSSRSDFIRTAIAAAINATLLPA